MVKRHSRHSLLLDGLLAGAVLTIAIGPVWGQAKVDAPKDAAKDRAEAKKGDDKRDEAGPGKGAKPGVKDAREEAKGTAPRDAPRADSGGQKAKGPKDDAAETRKGPRDAAKDTPPARRDAADPRANKASEKSGDDRDPTKAAREDARDSRKEDSRDSRKDASDRRDQEARRDQDTRRDARQETSRESSRSDSRSERRDFRAEDIRSADVGLWFDSSSNQGLVISDVASSGAIARVGFREGDRIVSVNGQRITREADFIHYLFAPDIRNERVKVIVMRNNREEIVYVEPAVLVEQYSVVEADPLETFGIVLDDRYTDRLIVWKVIPRTPAFYAGLRAGDVITTFGGRRVTVVNDLVPIISQGQANQIAVGVNRNQATRQLQVDMSSARQSSQTRTARRETSEQSTTRDQDRREQRQDAREERREDRQADRRDQPRTESRDDARSDRPTPRSGAGAPGTDRPATKAPGTAPSGKAPTAPQPGGKAPSGQPGATPKGQ